MACIFLPLYKNISSVFLYSRNCGYEIRVRFVADGKATEIGPNIWIGATLKSQQFGKSVTKPIC